MDAALTCTRLVNGDDDDSERHGSMRRNALATITYIRFAKQSPRGKGNVGTSMMAAPTAWYCYEVLVLRTKSAVGAQVLQTGHSLMVG